MIYFCRKCNLYYDFKFLKDLKINTKFCLICLLETMEKIFCDADVQLDMEKKGQIQEPLICDYGYIDVIYYMYENKLKNGTVCKE